MRDKYVTERVVEINPGALPVAKNQTREEKVRSAIARLGTKWVLRDTRGGMIQQLHDEGWDLV